MDQAEAVIDVLMNASVKDEKSVKFRESY